MVADKGKKQKVGDEEQVVDGDLVLSIEKLQEIQDQLEQINEEANEKVMEVEQKYSLLRKPVYDKRNEIVKSIPDFWLTAFLSHPALGDLLTEEDGKIFKYLSSLEVEDTKDVKAGYSISFIFNPNPYFEDSKLTKTFTFLDEGTIKTTATSIKWKEGMGIPNGVVHEKKGKRSLAEESFFTWFNEALHMDDIQDEVAEVIKDDLWPSPLTYFNNDGDDDDEEEGGEFVFEDEDEEKGSDGSEDDDDEQDDGEESDEDGN
ncbi:NAP1-related protein 2-like [Impatiens glandulifera]|uniref:NAP1-related protein 2-like n=1 Tax=Impatiens glandulifera TaxID=253017 RepID=UPI001FB11A4B|nr:NAP1-related protein 2-like [Impatiens glandulifera]